MAQKHHRTIVRLAAIAIAALGFGLSNPANAGGLTVHLDGEAEKGFLRCGEQLLADAERESVRHFGGGGHRDHRDSDQDEVQSPDYEYGLSDWRDMRAWARALVGEHRSNHHGGEHGVVPVSTAPAVGQVPEPTSLALATLGLIGLGVARRRTTRKA